MKVVTVYLIYDPEPSCRYTGKPIENPESTDYVKLGGGSSTPAFVRVYGDESKAERMRKRYWPHCKIKPVDLVV